MAVYSRGITYNDKIATITISRQLQKRADNCDRLLFTYAKALWFQIDPGQPQTDTQTQMDFSKSLLFTSMRARKDKKDYY